MKILPIGKLRKNKPNTNPIKPNLLNAQMNVNKVLTKDYGNRPPLLAWENKPNSNPIQACPEQRRMDPISKQAKCRRADQNRGASSLFCPCFGLVTPAQKLLL